MRREAGVHCARRGELASVLRRDQVRDLALDRREQPLLLPELRADPGLRVRALLHEANLVLPRVHERVLARRHLVLERDHLAHHRGVLLGDRLHRLDAVHQIVEALRAEQDRERRLVVAGGVDRQQPLLERCLRLHEVRARHDSEFAQNVRTRDATIAAQRAMDKDRHAESLQLEPPSQQRNEPEKADEAERKRYGKAEIGTGAWGTGERRIG